MALHVKINKQTLYFPGYVCTLYNVREAIKQIIVIIRIFLKTKCIPPTL